MNITDKLQQAVKVASMTIKVIGVVGIGIAVVNEVKDGSK